MVQRPAITVRRLSAPTTHHPLITGAALPARPPPFPPPARLSRQAWLAATTSPDCGLCGHHLLKASQHDHTPQRAEAHRVAFPACLRTIHALAPHGDAHTAPDQHSPCHILRQSKLSSARPGDTVEVILCKCSQHIPLTASSCALS